MRESLDRTQVLLVPSPGSPRHALVDRITAGSAERLGSGIEIDAEIVDDIPAEASGKYRYVTSKVQVAQFQ